MGYGALTWPTEGLCFSATENHWHRLMLQILFGFKATKRIGKITDLAKHVTLLRYQNSVVNEQFQFGNPANRRIAAAANNEIGNFDLATPQESPDGKKAAKVICISVVCLPPTF